ncbi:alpha/beta fold hydrolase BchO [Aurantiacibacter sediminis]|uniref:Alpha/beta fold hydrolase n=1 Tax=Aurantiacibacter sediminis TaxID=2793064 RepID=A0ABS0N219_9SPHN|nr:alpha/beta fold hydrolase BchO [Aurantiacibacter sediminis]MBH5321992.1 alpha/beta fold hydrolase [Aurantiacibacter sediminis]
MRSPLNRDRELPDWPNAEASRFVTAGGLDWHVQQMGEGPSLLLLHGTGASCHSWAGVMEELANDFTLIVPDLPGHGFTAGSLRGGPTLANVTKALAALLGELGRSPDAIVGHSAGVAIALDYARTHTPDIPVVGFGPAITPFPGLAAKLFPAMAKMLFVNPLVPRIFAATTRIPGETERFLRRATGSKITPGYLACYEALLGNHRHCEGALEMMANWDLDTFSDGLGEVTNPVLLVHGRKDKAVPTGAVEGAASRLPNAQLTLLDDLGHLAHEEDAEAAAELIGGFVKEQSAAPSGHAEGDHELDER